MSEVKEARVTRKPSWAKGEIDKPEDETQKNAEVKLEPKASQPSETAKVTLPATSLDKRLYEIDAYDQRVREMRKRQKNKLKRTPLSGGDRLVFPEREGFKNRVVNDVDGRVERAMEAGYRPVRGDMDGGTLKVGDTREPGSIVTKGVGGGVTGVLMEIDRATYDFDQKNKWAKIDELEESMKRNDKSPDSSGLYGKVQMERGS